MIYQFWRKLSERDGVAVPEVVLHEGVVLHKPEIDPENLV